MKTSSKSIRTVILFLILFTCLLLFLKLSEEVWSKESIIQLDKQIVAAVYKVRTPLLSQIMLAITSLANVFTVGIVTALISAYLWTSNKKKWLIPLIVTVAANSIFIEIVKIIFARPRPLLEHALVIEKTFSYPSGHTLIAITFYGLLAIYLFRMLKNDFQKYCAILIGIVIILSVGFSRIYLGAHWPSDVLGSYLLGVSWLCFVLISLEYKEQITTFFIPRVKS